MKKKLESNDAHGEIEKEDNVSELIESAKALSPAKAEVKHLHWNFTNCMMKKPCTTKQSAVVQPVGWRIDSERACDWLRLTI